MRAHRSYISAFVLTETLLPLLKRTAAEPASDVRIVNVRPHRPHLDSAPSEMRRVAQLYVARGGACHDRHVRDQGEPQQGFRRGFGYD